MGCELWSLALRKERRLMCFRIGCRGGYLWLRDEVTGEWREPHNEELNLLATEFYI
jgi:hypothetical protein